MKINRPWYYRIGKSTMICGMKLFIHSQASTVQHFADNCFKLFHFVCLPVFQLKFHWMLFLRVQLTILSNSIGSDNGMAPNRRRTINRWRLLIIIYTCNITVYACKLFMLKGLRMVVRALWRPEAHWVVCALVGDPGRAVGECSDVAIPRPIPRHTPKCLCTMHTGERMHCKPCYKYMQDNYVYTQDNYVYVQDNYVYRQNQYIPNYYVYMITHCKHIFMLLRNICSHNPPGLPYYAYRCYRWYRCFMIFWIQLWELASFIFRTTYISSSRYRDTRTPLRVIVCMCSAHISFATGSRAITLWITFTSELHEK